jgi:hypothetical protein
MKGNEITLENREAFRRYVEEKTGWAVMDQNIRSIEIYNRTLTLPVRITLGEELDLRFADTPGETVMAIFQSNAYLVITSNRGGLRGTPYLFGLKEVVKVETE